MVIAEKISLSASMVAALASLVKRKIAGMLWIKPTKKLQGKKLVLIASLIVNEIICPLV